ncbi:TonB-dependent receptor [soil metagenome]
MGRGALRTGISLAASIAAASAAATLPGAAHAGGRVEAAGSTVGEAADIIVTATRRAAPLSTIPIAVSAIDGAAMHNSGATDIRQLNQLAPSLLISSTGSEANAVARVRGIGTVGDNPGLESSVGVFIDGVYRPRTGAALTELGDVERVELLRGPQGTLFGRNTSAGLIAITTRAPQFEPHANGEFSYGNYDYWRLAAHVNGPVNRSVAVSLDAVLVRRDGFLEMVDRTGARIGSTNDRNRELVRGQLLVRPDDRFSLRLIGDYTHRDEHCCGAVYTDLGEETGSSPATAVPNASNRIVTLLSKLGTTYPNGSTPATQDPYRRRISITPGRDYVSRVEDWGVSAEAVLDLGDVTLTSLSAYRSYMSSDYGDYDYSGADLLYRDPGTYRKFINVSQELRAQGKAFGGRLDWLVGAYYGHETLSLRDNIRFGTDYGRFAACRLLAGVGTSPTALFPLAPDCAAPSGLAGLSAQLIAGGFPAALAPIITGGLSTLATVGDAGDVDSRYRQTSETFALFTHNIVRLGRGIELSLGLRHSWDAKHFSAMLNNDNGACAALQVRGPGAPDDLVDIATMTNAAGQPLFGNVAALAGGILTLGCLGNGSPALNALMLDDRMHGAEFSGTAALSWRPTDSLMLYASYARGYKAGGYNLDRFELGNRGIGVAVSPTTFFAPRMNSDAMTLSFQPETVDAYEIGVKFHRGPVSLNIAGFRQLFHDFQLNTFNGTSFVVQNIGGCGGAASVANPCPKRKAGLVSQGAEGELALAPRADLILAGGVTYVDARFADALAGSADGTIPLDPALFLLPGNRASNAPRIVGTASATWTPALGRAGLSALLYLDGRATSSYNMGSDLYPEKRQPAYLLMNARIGLRGSEQRWAVEFWCQNLLDTDYAQLTFNSPLQGSGPANQSVAQLGRAGTVMTNQLFSAYLGEPRTYGLTLRWRM